jgi:predicted nucleic acid-binding protein
VAASLACGKYLAVARTFAAIAAMLVDTSVWVDHFRKGDAALSGVLSRGEVECHPFVIGELACGSLRRRSEVLSLLHALPSFPLGSQAEALTFIEQHHLMNSGIGWIDVHLLVSASLAGGRIWTRDRRLAEVARLMHLYAEPSRSHPQHAGNLRL